ncbi:hypothetical protein JQ631_29685 [Bradyrhizobium manausense]|uniref:hypothetical protein n=1 Tax=Bradyrhizobium manausense TaxID=989370 RepID=UPI001BAA1278|nr:hypothetical protein [Bradyrhizobium manausense]MBR0793268.1 hypothetical protein [Bradyrhizobium manausense]
MKACLTIGLTLAALCAVSRFAEARPPTVMNSPGYDARLQESRKALGATTTPAPDTQPVTTPRKSKKKHTH